MRNTILAAAIALAIASPVAAQDARQVAAALSSRDTMFNLMDRFCRQADDYQDCALDAVHASMAFDEEVERLFEAPAPDEVYQLRATGLISCAEAAGVPHTLDMPLMAHCLTGIR